MSRGSRDSPAAETVETRAARGSMASRLESKAGLTGSGFAAALCIGSSESRSSMHSMQSGVDGIMIGLWGVERMHEMAGSARRG